MSERAVERAEARRDDGSARWSVAREAEQVPEVFAARFNGPEPAAAVAGMYEPEAVFVAPDGQVARGAAAIAEANAGFLALRRPIAVRPRSVTVAGEVALLVVDWELAGEGPGGRVGGTATDVARRGPDGIWRYLIDHPTGGGTLDGPATG
ncbi:DUF4440 domain-containing protein [Streptomyces sp. 3MP-14]|uniref:DUF4440 domain-containing protein n=1 Tax=Streptomyces mimosae TaxID=2586635 RepID=A0A5N6A9E2_9ACTN|nr:MULTISPECIES: DUF4440 domain-containing protein [Streptomyces]KAB8165271.1 DUF4440 domain-containing protein [Streptomyces mimosae]KAB8175903.1 DUF4440 domain-containing protein [Streptomyces sp. 3MP-14]